MEVDGHLLDADYVIEDGEPVIRLFLRSERGPVLARYHGFEPYLYVVPEEGETEALKEDLASLSFEANDETVSVERVEEETLTDEKEEVMALKTVVSIPPDVPKVKDEVKEWEAVDHLREFDIPFYKRFLVDTGLKPPSRVRVSGEEIAHDPFEGVTLRAESVHQDDPQDILANDSLAFDLEVYQDEIIMCSFYADGFEKVLVTYDAGFSHEYVEVVEDEARLLERLIEVFEDRDPDILLGYNTDEFDFDKLRERCQEHGMELKMGRLDERMTFQRRGRFSGATVKGRVHLDLYAFVANVVGMTMQSETLSLDAVAEELLGENKEDMAWNDIKEAWREKENLDELASYALRDSELAYKLGRSLVPQIFSLSTLTGMVPFDTCRTSYGQLVENFMIRKAYQQGILVPNRPTQGTIAARSREGAYVGGFVYEPEQGLHENIALFDFRSLYPTIIVSHNISPDVLDVDGCEEDVEVEVEESDAMYSFCQDERGFIPGILESLVSERYEIKGELPSLEEGSQEYRDRYFRQSALKILSNAFYGYLGYASARWYSRPCAEATTYLGRKYIHDTIDVAEEMGLEVVYGDTDSVFIKGEDVRETSERFQDRVNDMLPEFMELELEGLFVRGLFTYTDSGRGAKKKYALLDDEGKVKITGFEYVRRDWSQVAKQTQKEVIDQVLEGEVEAAVETVKETIERLKKGKVPVEELKIYTTLTKKPENYDSKAPHVEAAKKAMKRDVDISPGDTIDYVVTSGAQSISDRAELTRFAEDYDAQYYIDNQIVPVSLRVLKVFGYTEGQLKGKGKQSGLGKFT
jgi:DNA polymerase elongation subunit (family B)